MKLLLILLLLSSALCYRLAGDWQYSSEKGTTIVNVVDGPDQQGFPTRIFSPKQCMKMKYTFVVIQQFLQLRSSPVQESYCENLSEEVKELDRMIRQNILCFEINGKQLLLATPSGNSSLPFKRVQFTIKRPIIGKFISKYGSIDVQNEFINLCNNQIQANYQLDGVKISINKSMLKQDGCDTQGKELIRILQNVMYYRWQGNKIGLYNKDHSKSIKLQYIGENQKQIIPTNAQAQNQPEVNIQPQITTPETTSPETTTPETTTPEATPPQTTTQPEITTPETTTQPEITTPEISIHEISTPQATTHQTTAPEVTLPQTSQAQTNSRQTYTPSIQSSQQPGDGQRQIALSWKDSQDVYSKVVFSGLSSDRQPTKVAIQDSYIAFQGCNAFLYRVNIPDDTTIIVKPQPEIRTKIACGDFDQPFFDVIPTVQYYRSFIDKDGNLQIRFFNINDQVVFGIVKPLSPQALKILEGKVIQNQQTTNQPKQVPQIRLDPSLVGKYRPQELGGIPMPASLVQNVEFIISLNTITILACNNYMYSYDVSPKDGLLTIDTIGKREIEGNGDCDKSDDALWLNQLSKVAKYTIYNNKDIELQNENGNQIIKFKRI